MSMVPDTIRSTHIVFLNISALFAHPNKNAYSARIKTNLKPKSDPAKPPSPATARMAMSVLEKIHYKRSLKNLPYCVTWIIQKYVPTTKAKHMPLPSCPTLLSPSHSKPNSHVKGTKPSYLFVLMGEQMIFPKRDCRMDCAQCPPTPIVHHWMPPAPTPTLPPQPLRHSPESPRCNLLNLHYKIES